MFNYLLYRLGQFIALHLPLKMGYAIAVFISDLHYIFANKDRQEVRENLKVIFPEKTEREIRIIRKQMSRNFAKYLVDFFRFAKLNKEYVAKHIKIENSHYFDQALKYGKGVIVLTAHLGNWELGGVVMTLSGYPLWAVALEHRYKKVDNFFNFQRESKGLHVIPLKRAVRQCLDVLRDNKMVALVGDRDFTGKGVPVKFFGKTAFIPDGPAAFSLRTGASIVPGFMLRNPDDTFTLKIEEPLKFNGSKDKKADLMKLIMQYNAIMEKYIRQYPDQWYMFRRFWAENAK